MSTYPILLGDDSVKMTRMLGFLFLLAALAPPDSVTGQQSASGLEAGVHVTPDVVYGHKDGMALTFDVFHPSNAHGGAVLYMVSGGWISRWSPPEWLITRSFRGLLDKGLTVVAVRHGSAPRYKVPEAEADVRRALRYIRLHSEELGIDENRLGVFGGSAGGHLSLMLGLASDDGVMGSDDEILRTPARVGAVVAYYPPVDLRAIVGPSERFPALDFAEEKAASISPILFASPDDPPTLLIHGDADMLVNVRNSEVMYEALQGEGVESELIIVPGGNHGFRLPADRERAQQAMVEWFDRHLGR
ncbi:MAG TPA: alpha/beta hydrolase [Gemmatimonadetes bacterium]|jgi:acetyl esterase/lipase|nr:alpha/beta hydrolase [Gemmatimonadota bacterium]HIC14319.1 alpha/beta hydrolase [Gemmatimonadota bacterium]